MNILKALKRIYVNLTKKNRNTKMRRRRESVVSAYKKTTKFLTANTSSLLSIMPNRKYRLLTKLVEEYDAKISKDKNKSSYTSEEDDEDIGERDLDYYLGVRRKESFWRDPAGKEQIKKDFLVYHCGVTEEDYEINYKKSSPKVSYDVQPRLKQVPFKIHKKNRRKKRNLKDDSWKEKSLFRLFAYRRDSEYSTSDSYSECDSSEERKDSNSDREGSLNVNSDDEKGVRIKEVSEGRPCDNCPELCPGFIPHAWRKTCKSCGCDRLKHSVYHEELSSVRDRLGLRDSTPVLQSIDTLPGLNAKETDIFWQSLAERAPAGIGGATGPSAWRQWRTRALASQLPKQDLSLGHCRHVEEVHRKQYEDFVAARNEIALDIGIGRQVFGSSLECMGCTKPIRSGTIAIEAPRLGEQAYFHPACFSCCECEEPLVEFAYCALDGRLYCVRHYAEQLKPRCHACDELFKYCPGAASHPPCSPAPSAFQNASPFPFLFMFGCLSATCEMGIVLSVVISYAGIYEAIEFIRHLVNGVVPYNHPGFDDLVEYYTRELNKSAKTANDWTTQCGQGYLSLAEDNEGKLSAAAVKYYHGAPDSTAILFSTKISSFGDSVEEPPVANGNCRPERYSPSKTKTILLKTSPETYSVANRNKSPDADTQTPANSFDDRDTEENLAREDKLTWQYTPLNSNPEIHLQTYDDDDKPGVFTEDYLRSLDGIKYRPLQRSDPSGRRRSFRRNRSSSSNSSKGSRASRDEELQMFTSLEEAESEKMAAGNAGFESAPNLTAHSFRSRSRERRNENGIVDGSLDIVDDDAKPIVTPNHDSIDDQTKDNEVIEEEDDDVDFWANSGD